jgi:hypothetical protein
LLLDRRTDEVLVVFFFLFSFKSSVIDVVVHDPND